jgi:hypothetical protein
VIENLPATDAAGYAGLEDEVDFHTWQLLKGIGLATILGVGTQLTLGNTEGDIVRVLRESISYLVGIFKGLNILYSDKLADAWVKRPNTNRIFGGQMPLAYMMTGGLPAMQIVRRLVDARRGGM